jgi:two-component system NarL family response regulator
MNILICDDDPSFALNLSLTLKQHNLGDVTIAGDGKEAITKIQSAKYDLIISDLHMPEAPGEKVIEYIRGIKSAVPIIVITSDTEEIVVQRLREIGANEVFDKKVPIEKIVKAVTKLTAKRRFF